MKHRIATLDGVFTRNPHTGLYEPYEPAERHRHPLLIIFAGAIVAWLLFIGAGYALYMAFEALAAF